MISAMPPLEVAPSILAADHGRLRAQVEVVQDAGARVIHVDVMDGHFVPPVALGPGRRRRAARPGLHLEVHLMVERPERTQIAAFAKAGAGTIYVHAEATPHVNYTVAADPRRGLPRRRRAHARRRRSTCSARSRLDIALLMTVNPGGAARRSSPASLDKIAAPARRCSGRTSPIEVDGGIDERTAGPVAAAGATRLVAGTAVFGTDDPAAAYARDRTAAARRRGITTV